MAAGQVRVDDFVSTKMPRLRRWEHVAFGLWPNLGEPQARCYNRAPHSVFRIPHWQRTLFLNSFWDGRLGQMAFE
jgi:hypothetical protein